jgi:hypothetical protein
MTSFQWLCKTSTSAWRITRSLGNPVISDTVIRRAFKYAFTVVFDASWSLVSAFVAESNVSDRVVARCVVAEGYVVFREIFKTLKRLTGILSWLRFYCDRIIQAISACSSVEFLQQSQAIGVRP